MGALMFDSAVAGTGMLVPGVALENSNGGDAYTTMAMQRYVNAAVGLSQGRLLHSSDGGWQCGLSDGAATFSVEAKRAPARYM